MTTRLDELHRLNDRLAALLTGVANALKGDPTGTLMLHNWSDLPAVAAKLKLERDEARAQFDRHVEWDLAPGDEMRDGEVRW